MKYQLMSVLLAMMFLGACERSAAVQTRDNPSEVQTAEDEKRAAPPKYHYSPFVVQVPQSEMVFGVITFKDVGLQRESKDPNDPVLETIAESVSYSLQSVPQLEVRQSRVEYHEEMSDPANHRSCETNHLYVDVWDGGEKWGYSLWSGCGEEDNFAWQEVSIPPNTSSLPDRVEPLAESIAQTLAEAHDRGCYTKQC